MDVHPGEPERLFFWARIRPEQARHPDHVIARNCFRDLFAEWKNGAPAYLGAPGLLRPRGTSGLVLVSAEFKCGTRLPAKSKRLEPADFSGVREDAVLFGVRWPGAELAGIILKRLKEGRVKFQTVRQGASRWHVVAPAYRAKTGITALREDAELTELFCHRHPLLPGSELASFAGLAGSTFALLAKIDEVCPVCKGGRFGMLKSIDTEAPPTCFDCLTKPGRN